MAIRRSIPPTVINGTVTSPDARFPNRADLSRYTLECTVTSVADLTDPTKSCSVFIEYMDDAGVWRSGGGSHWAGGDATHPANAVFTVRSWEQTGGTVKDTLKGKRVRIKATAPASDYETGLPLWEGTTGPVTVSAQIVDERSN